MKKSFEVATHVKLCQVMIVLSVDSFLMPSWLAMAPMFLSAMNSCVNRVIGLGIRLHPRQKIFGSFPFRMK
jgi:hypothetical protein